MKKSTKRFVSLLLIVALVSYICLSLFLMIPSLRDFFRPARYIKSDEATVQVAIPFENNGEADEEIITLTRGEQVRLREAGDRTSTVSANGKAFELDNKYLAETVEDAIAVDTVYPRRLVNLRTEKGGALADTIVTKGEALPVVSVAAEDLNPQTGMVNWYQVRKDGQDYWINGASVEVTEEEALKNYGSTLTYSKYWDEYYGEGYSEDAYINQIDYKPIIKESYPDNPRPEEVNAIHLSLENLINHKEAWKALKDISGINGYVIELKGDGGDIFYNSEVIDKYLDDPEKAQLASSYDLEYVKNLFKEFQDAGFYMTARIVTFKDAVYARQNPENSMVDSHTNELVLHNGEYWPSPYSRKVWQYNVDIAKEIAPMVNEIQFDYVRFPDGTLQDNLDGKIDFHNQYNESKVSALQGFLTYAREELAPYHVYVAADVFAWPIVAKDDQDIGQYLPALANVADVICPMPYADHFSKGAMGIEDPVKEPKRTMYEFSAIVKAQLAAMENPAQYRTWIMGYGGYGPEEMSAQIDGINDAGYEGYIVWGGAGNYDLINSYYEGLKSSKIEEQ